MFGKLKNNNACNSKEYKRPSFKSHGLILADNKIRTLFCTKMLASSTKRWLMTYELLHHLTQAELPVVIYDQQLIQQLSAYENQSLIVLAQRDGPRRTQLFNKKVFRY